jgi:hypothetical protein
MEVSQDRHSSTGFSELELLDSANGMLIPC